MRLSDLHKLHSESASVRLLAEALEFCLPYAEAVAEDRERIVACGELLEAAKGAGQQPQTLQEFIDNGKRDRDLLNDTLFPMA